MRFIRGNTHVHLLSPIDASSDGLHIYLALSEQPLLGLDDEADSAPVSLHPTSDAAGIFP